MVGFAVEINETNLFDDIILPFPSALERSDFVPGMGAYMIAPCGQDDFYWQVREPVVEIAPGIRPPQEVMQEIAERLGILGDLYRLINHQYRLKPTMRSSRTRRYPIAEVIDRTVRSWFGEEHDLAWFREHGVIRHPRDVEEAYIGPYPQGEDTDLPRTFPGSRREQLKGVVGKLGLRLGHVGLSAACPITCRVLPTTPSRKAITI